MVCGVNLSLVVFEIERFHAYGKRVYSVPNSVCAFLDKVEARYCEHKFLGNNLRLFYSFDYWKKLRKLVGAKNVVHVRGDVGVNLYIAVKQHGCPVWIRLNKFPAFEAAIFNITIYFEIFSSLFRLDKISTHFVFRKDVVSKVKKPLLLSL